MSLLLAEKLYPTYILTDETTQNYLELVPSRGGIVTSWVVQGQEVFYMDKERYADPNLSIRGGNPILFPICGNLPDNTYTYSGNSYQLKQHGFARDSVWQMVSHTDNSATIELTSSDRTLVNYPFDFRLQMTYKLTGNSLTIQADCTNLSNQAMPFALGFHPYFSIANKTSITLEIPAQFLWNNITKETESYTGNWDFEQAEVDSALYLESEAKSVKMTTDRGQLEIKFDPEYRVCVVWTVKGKDYICLEPWTAGRNAINTGENLLYLDPQTTKSLTVEYIYQPKF